MIQARFPGLQDVRQLGLADAAAHVLLLAAMKHTESDMYWLLLLYMILYIVYIYIYTEYHRIQIIYTYDMGTGNCGNCGNGMGSDVKTVKWIGTNSCTQGTRLGWRRHQGSNDNRGKTATERSGIVLCHTVMQRTTQQSGKSVWPLPPQKRKNNSTILLNSRIATTNQYRLVQEKNLTSSQRKKLHITS